MGTTRRACTTGQLYDALPRSMVEALTPGRISQDHNWYRGSVELMLDKIDRECRERKRKGRVEYFVDSDGFTKYWLDENPHEPARMTYKQRGEINQKAAQNKRGVDPMVAAARAANANGNTSSRPVTRSVDDTPADSDKLHGEAKEEPTEAQKDEFVSEVAKVGLTDGGPTKYRGFDFEAEIETAGAAGRIPSWKAVAKAMPRSRDDALTPAEIAALFPDSGLNAENVVNRIKNIRRMTTLEVNKVRLPGVNRRFAYWISQRAEVPGEAGVPLPKKYTPPPAEKKAAKIEDIGKQTGVWKTADMPERPVRFLPPREFIPHDHSPTAEELIKAAYRTGNVVTPSVTVIEEGVKVEISKLDKEEGEELDFA